MPDITPNLLLTKPLLNGADSMGLWPANNEANKTILQDIMRFEYDTYTPVWEAPTSPSLGNGTIEGRFLRIWPNLVVAWASITMGSTTTYGSGFYSISLPVAASALLNADGNTGRGQSLGCAVLRDNSSTANSCTTSPMLYTDTSVRFTNENGSSVWSVNNPFTLASGDALAMQVMYPTDVPWT